MVGKASPEFMSEEVKVQIIVSVNTSIVFEKRDKC